LDCLKRPTLLGGRLVSSVPDNLNPVTGPVANGVTTTLSGTISAALADRQEGCVFRINIGVAALEGARWTCENASLSNHEVVIHADKVMDAAGHIDSVHQQSDAHAHPQYQPGGAVDEDRAAPWVMKRMNLGAESLSKRRGHAPHFTSASTLQSGAGHFSFM